MTLQSIFDAILLGIVEGVTEFIPVSSTAHLLLSTELLGLGGGAEKAFWDTFNVMIQLGAILAVVVVYFGRLWGVLIALPNDPAAVKSRPEASWSDFWGGPCRARRFSGGSGGSE